MDPKFRILLASETYPPDVNGAAVFVERLATMLSKNGHEILVVAPSPTYEDMLETPAPHLKVQRVKSVPLKPIHPYFRITWKGGLTPKIRKVITDFKPDLMHIHNHFLLGRTCLKIAKQKGIPVIGTNHFMPDNLLEYFPKVSRGTVSNYMWKDLIKTYNQLDYVTAPTKVALNMIKELGLDLPSKVISNGIDLEEFKKSYTKKDKPTFLFVGRLEQDKNIDLILKALDANRDIIHTQTIIVGMGKDEIALQKLAQELNLGDTVTFTGHVTDDELTQLYNRADVYIGSGSAELQGLAVRQAMAHGLPILAANAVALPELVENGLNGYLFELDYLDLAAKMKLILKDLSKLKTMGKNSLKIIKGHSKEHTLKSFVALYASLISK